MSIDDTSARTSTPSPWAAGARTVAINVLAWTAICAAGSLAAYPLRLQQGLVHNYGDLLARWLLFHVPVMVLSSGISLALARWPALFESRRRTGWIFLALVVFFLPCELFYVACVTVHYDGAPVTLAAGWDMLLPFSKGGGFNEFAWITGTYIAMAAIGNWRQAKAREQAWQRAQTENLKLNLALEQQRMLALRAQLEPHFIFNALNAISALVRSGDKPVALTGISRLSDLLRYALSASSRDTVGIAEEMRFVRDYLDLQRLRYGGRLQVHIDGADNLSVDDECPPLLLQPLLENALRHDLDCHDGPADIRLSFERLDGHMLIKVSNPVSEHASPNPGAGLGLRNTRARLELTDPAASLHAGRVGERFLAEIRLPLREPG